MKRVYILKLSSDYIADKRPRDMSKKRKRGVISPNDTTSERIAVFVNRCGEQVGYKHNARFESLEIAANEIFKALFSTLAEVSDVVLAACVSVAAKKEDNFFFNLDDVLAIRCSKESIDLFVSTELYILLGNSVLGPSALNICDEKKIKIMI